ncbi:MAG: PHB depolymerase family esterase [Hydrogenophaga sp.]|nr:PHB depolymerase family esterase [Hydrogenophaga sp.]
MRRRSAASPWMKAFNRGVAALTRSTVRAATQATRQALKSSAKPAAKGAPARKTPTAAKATAKAKAGLRSPRSSPATAVRRPPAAAGDWIAGSAVGPTGARRFRLYRPPGMLPAERLPLLVMLHGCGQDAQGFAESTRMNAIARRERFLVLYPEQDRFSNPQACWNWYETRNGRANAELALILLAIDQVCLLHRGDRQQVALAGLSAGASMAALLASRHPARFRAVVMHSGVGPGAAHSTATALAAMRGLRQPGAHEDPLAQPLPPLLAIQGGLDRIVSSGNAAAAVRVWNDAANARMGAPRRVQRGQRYPMTVTTSRKKGRTVATLVEIDALGHAWSGGLARLPYGDDKGADASRMVWAFVARQLPGTPDA